MSIEDAVTAYFKTFEGGDATALAALFTDDAVIAPVGTDTIRGRAAIEDTFKAFFSAISMTSEDLSIDRVHQLGDAAFVETHSTETINNHQTGTTESVRYRELFCLERANGDWRIASYMFNQ